MNNKNNIKLLDCTLRDGGYINNWIFGKKNISYILDKLNISNVDFIEIGYLNQSAKTNNDSTQFNSILIDDTNCCGDNKNKICMINFGDYDVDLLEKYSSKSKACGIRLAFHKKDLKNALDAAKKIKEKGYLVFIQPMVTDIYSEQDLLYLIEKSNQIKPYSIYFVDSFGSMKFSDIDKMVDLFDANLNSEINIGFHSHNNLQMSFSNVVRFINKISEERTIFIDSSVYGMGRGAGNLATELIMNYLNENFCMDYDIEPILDVINNVLSIIRQESYWGYSVEYFISASYKCHPNYAKHLMDKQTITINDIKKIISSIPFNKKNNFDKKYIESLYENYMDNHYDDKDSYERLKKILYKKNILLVGPGPSILKYYKKIEKMQKNRDFITILINNNTDLLQSDYIFINNKKRLNKMDIKTNNLILTSNLTSINDSLDIIKFDYYSNLVSNAEIKDNSLLMFLNILVKIGVKKVYLAGFDGFSVDILNNHYDSSFISAIDRKQIELLNESIKLALNDIKVKIKLNFITPSKYEEEKEG